MSSISHESLLPTVVAMEGIGGCGKSHTQHLVEEILRGEGKKVITHKIAGLGDSSRVQFLKRIKKFRYELAVKGQLSEKQQKDAQKDRIFRMAMRHQARAFLALLQKNEFDIAILDRTPLMCWVFSAAHDACNPYLEEIFNEAVSIIEMLQISSVFLFDVRPVVSYARALARCCSSIEEVKQEIERINTKSFLSDEVVSEILHLTELQLQRPINKQEKESWDILPIDALQRERELHFEALSRAAKLIHLDLMVINAEQTIDEVVANILEHIKQTSVKNQEASL